MSMRRGTTNAEAQTAWVEVDLAAVAENFRLAVRAAGHPGFAVVKADAYGHGAQAVAQHLLEQERSRLHGFFVARPEEAEGLIEGTNGAVAEGIETVVLGVFPASLGAKARRQLFQSQRRLGWTPSCASLEDLRCWAAASGAPVHLEVDVGMQRTGLPLAQLGEACELLAAAKLRLSGVFAHFSESEAADSAETARQAARFRAAIQAHPALARARCHLANTCAVFSGCAGADLAGELPGSGPRTSSFRCGGGLYGLDLTRGADGEQGCAPLRPAMSVRSLVVQVRFVAAGSTVGYGGRYRQQRDGYVGVVPVGYADGVPRGAIGAEVLVGGQERRVVGAVSMDLLTIDLGEQPPRDDLWGAEVTLLGPGIPAEQWAKWADTISYEITCGFGRRLPRRYPDPGNRHH